MGKKYRHHPGDVVHVSGNFYGQNGRYAVVLADRGSEVSFVPVMPVTTRRGKVLDPRYHLLPNEIFIPDGIQVQGKDAVIHLRGVIKVDNIYEFPFHQVSAKMDEISLDTKERIVRTYKSILKDPSYRREFSKGMTEYQKVMNWFEDAVIAEKLNFLTNDSGENDFNKRKREYFHIKEIQLINRRHNLTIYSVLLENQKGSSYLYTLSSSKSQDEMLKQWTGSRPGYAWLKEDVKYHALRRNLDRRIHPEPYPDPTRYQTFHVFKNDHITRKSTPVYVVDLQSQEGVPYRRSTLAAVREELETENFQDYHNLNDRAMLQASHEKEKGRFFILENQVKTPMVLMKHKGQPLLTFKQAEKVVEDLSLLNKRTIDYVVLFPEKNGLVFKHMPTYSIEKEKEGLFGHVMKSQMLTEKELDAVFRSSFKPKQSKYQNDDYER